MIQELSDSRLVLHQRDQELRRVGGRLQQVEEERQLQARQLQGTQNALQQAIRWVKSSLVPRPSAASFLVAYVTSDGGSKVTYATKNETADGLGMWLGQNTPVE